MEDIEGQRPRTILSLSPPDVFDPAYQRWRHRLPEHDLRLLNERSTEACTKVLPEADLVFGDWLGRIGLDRGAIDIADRCVAIIQPTAGYQLIDVDAAKQRGIPVANAPGANAVAVAEWVIMTALMLLRQALPKHQELSNGIWRQQAILSDPVFELQGKTLGIIGFGNIGRQLARRLSAFSLDRLLYTDEYRADPDIEEALGVEYTELDELCASSDIVTMHVPLTPHTQDLMDGRRLAQLKEGAIVINASRGAVVDEEELRRQLDTGRLRGAALDVFSEEPLPPEHLWRDADNVVLSPHVAGASYEAIQRMIDMAFGDLARVLDGQPPEHTVNGVQGLPRLDGS